MNNVLKQSLCIFLYLYGFQQDLYSQFNDPRMQFGISAGSFIYQGDLTPSATGSYKTMKPVVQLFAARFFSPFFLLRGNLAFGSLSGNDSKYSQPAYRQERNFNFRTPVAEISGIAELNVLGRNYSSRGFAPYLFTGIGFNLLKIKRDWSQFNPEYFGGESELMAGLATDVQRSLPRSLLVFPAGIGARYYLSDKIGLSVETAYRGTRTDYLDGFSQSANHQKNDHYYSHTIGIVYRMGKKNMLDCPVVKY